MCNGFFLLFGKLPSEMDKNVIIFSAITVSRWPFSKNRVLVASISFLFLTLFLLANDAHTTLYSRRHEFSLTNRNGNEERNESKQVTVANVSCNELMLNHGCYKIVQGEHEKPKYKPLELTELIRLKCSRRAPSAIVIGTKKSGTTTLKNFLSYHPDVAFAERELKFINNNDLSDLDKYIAVMPYSLPHQITMEKTPGYFVRLKVPSRIKSAIPNVKFIVIIRNPVNRAISDFVHMRYSDETRVGGAKLLKKSPKPGAIRYEVSQTFRESVLFENGSVRENNALIDTGIYVKYFRMWLQYFPLDQFLILDGEEFVKAPTPTMHRVESFLDIKPFFTEDHFYFNEEKKFHCLKKPLNTCMTKNKGRPHPYVDEDVIEKLNDFYSPFNKELEKFLNRTFSW